MNKSFDENELFAYLRDNLNIEASIGYFGGYGLALRLSLLLNGEPISRDTVSLSDLKQN